MSSEVGRRARKKLESGDRIVDCAAALFAARGYDATTMEEIGECADVSRATVFNYFPRKEDLVLAWFDRRRVDIAGVLVGNESQPGDASSRFHDAFRALAHIFEEDAQTGRAMVRAWLQAGGPLLTPDSDTTRLFADAIRAGQQHGDLAEGIDADLAGLVLFDAYLGMLYRWVTAEDEQLDLEQNLLAALNLILEGVAVPPFPRS
jgi:AcrR family transcriptional regulator